MKNLLFPLLFSLSCLTSCGQGDSNHQPDTPAKYQLTIGVEPSMGSRLSEVLPEVQEVLLQRIGQLGITYQSVKVDKKHGNLTFNLIDVPAEWGTGEEALQNIQAQLLAKATLGFAQAYRINDPGISDAFLNFPLDSLQAAGFQFNDGYRSRGVLGTCTSGETDAIDQLLAEPRFREKLPPDLVLIWSAKMENMAGLREPAMELFGLKLLPDGKYPLTEQELAECYAYPNSYDGQIAINLTFNSEGAKLWEHMTSQAFQDQNRQIGIVLNDRVATAPNVQSPIKGGQSMITGNFTEQEALALASQINLARLSNKITVLKAKQL